MKRTVLGVFFAIAACFAIAGCYSDRYTGVYETASDLQGSDDDKSGVLEESGRTPEDEARFRKIFELDSVKTEY